MQYIVVGVDVARGTVDDDVTPARPYFELGWEIVGTHLDVKRLKQSGNIGQDDVVVTCAGREFLYTAAFERVISYERFLAEREPADTVNWLVDRYAAGVLPSEYFEASGHSPTARYRYFDQDRDIIQSLATVDVSPLHCGSPYACVAVRRRCHGSYRNMSDRDVRTILRALGESYGRIFLVGHGAEQYAVAPKIQHVTLCSFASLIRQPMCRVVFGSLTGPMHLACLVSTAPVCVVLNHDAYDVRMLNHPVLMGHCITWSESRFLFITPEQLPELLERVRV